MVALLSVMALSGCDGADGDPVSVVNLEPDTGEPGLALVAPPFLNTRAIDANRIEPRVIVNDQLVEMQRNGTEWQGRHVVPEGEAALVTIRWIERVGSRQLPLADFRRQLSSFVSDRSLRITTSDYTTAGLDADDDGLSNLAERLGNTDPYNALDPGENSAQVFLHYINPAGAPVIDGQYDPIWNEAEFRDRNNVELRINHLMIDQGSTLLDGDTPYTWAGMHDGEYLYLLVFGESVINGQTPFGDSENLWQDDSVDIFWDGDNSKGNTYDGVDDTHLLVALLAEGGVKANNSSEPGARLMLGPNSRPFSSDDIDYAVCLCTNDRNVWEIRVRLSAAGIEVGRAFGFELQLNDDNDGGSRDAKWGWQHESRVDVDVDNTYRNPSFMGTARLEPPPR